MFDRFARHAARKTAFLCALAALFAFSLGFGFEAFAQVAPTPGPASVDVLGQIVAAIGSHNYVLVAALIAYAVVAFGKQGWFGNWWPTKIAAAALPYVSMAIGFAATWSADVIAGQNWQAAALNGLSGLVAAAFAVLGHQTVVEHMRGGKEFVPVAPWAKGPPPPSSGIPGNPDDVKRGVSLQSAPTVPSVKRETLIFPKNTYSLIRRRFRWVTPLVWAMGMTVVTGTVTGCSAAAWQSFVNSSTQFITYLETAIQTAEAIWAIVQPLIPAAQSATATAAYNDARVTLNASLSALQDAINAGNAAQAAPTDYAALEASVQAAFATFVGVVEQWQPLGAASRTLGAQPSLLAHEAAVIAAWR